MAWALSFITPERRAYPRFEVKPGNALEACILTLSHPPQHQRMVSLGVGGCGFLLEGPTESSLQLKIEGLGIDKQHEHYIEIRPKDRSLGDALSVILPAKIVFREMQSDPDGFELPAGKQKLYLGMEFLDTSKPRALQALEAFESALLIDLSFLRD